jgi:hypothetical protein
MRNKRISEPEKHQSGGKGGEANRGSWGQKQKINQRHFAIRSQHRKVSSS